jgi:uncharacterized protein YjdB
MHSERRSFLPALLALLTFSILISGCSGVRGSAVTEVTNSQATLVSISVSQVPQLAVGNTAQLTATGKFSDGTTNDLTAKATWTSSAPNVASVNAGMVTAVAAGSATISASMTSIKADTTVVVGSNTGAGGGGGTLTSVSVTPADATFRVGRTQQYTATGKFSDGSQQDLTTTAAWTSSSTATVTVDNKGLATGVATGNANITATVNGLSGAGAATILAPSTLESLTVTPENPSIAVGSTQAFKATGHYTDGSTNDDTKNVSWTSTAVDVATIDANGIASALKPGTTTIGANSGSIIANTGLTVTQAQNTLQSITISPENWTLIVGGTQQYKVTGHFGDGSTQDLTANSTWSSSNAALASIDANGLATAHQTGSVTISATANGFSDSTPLSITSGGGGGGGSANVLTWHNDNSRSGANLQETVLTPGNVNSGSFGKLYQFLLDGDPYAQPLYVSGLNINGGVHNVVFVATQHDSVYAFDADGKTLSPLWKHSFIDPANGVTTLKAPDDTGIVCCPGPEIGITGTPVIDRGRNTLYVLVRTKESGNLFQRLQALDLSTGAIKNTVRVNPSIPGTGDGGTTLTFNNSHENQRSALVLSNGVVWIAWAGHSDLRPYHGWLIGYNADSLDQVAVANVDPNGQGGGIWMSASGPAVDGAGNLVFTAGNGDFNPAKGNYGQSFLKVSPSGQFVDYFTPYNWADENKTDTDIGGGGALIPPQQGGAHPNIALNAGKDNNIYVVDLDNMGKFNSANNGQIVQVVTNAFSPNSSDIFRGSPAYFNGRVYFGALNDVLKAFSLSNGLLSTKPVAQGGTKFGFPGATPSISANGSANGIVWVIDNKGHGVLRAYDAATLKELYNSSSSRDDSGSNYCRFTVPTISNGKVFVGTLGSSGTPARITVYGLLN